MSLHDLRPGDEVAVLYGDTCPEIGTVERVGTREIRLGDGRRFLIQTGREVGAPRWAVSRSIRWVEPLTDDHRGRIELHAARARARNAHRALEETAQRAISGVILSPRAEAVRELDAVTARLDAARALLGGAP